MEVFWDDSSEASTCARLLLTNIVSGEIAKYCDTKVFVKLAGLVEFVRRIRLTVYTSFSYNSFSLLIVFMNLYPGMIL